MVYNSLGPVRDYLVEYAAYAFVHGPANTGGSWMQQFSVTLLQLDTVQPKDYHIASDGMVFIRFGLTPRYIDYAGYDNVMAVDVNGGDTTLYFLPNGATATDVGINEGLPKTSVPFSPEPVTAATEETIDELPVGFFGDDGLCQNFDTHSYNSSDNIEAAWFDNGCGSDNPYKNDESYRHEGPDGEYYIIEDLNEPVVLDDDACDDDDLGLVVISTDDLEELHARLDQLQEGLDILLNSHLSVRGVLADSYDAVLLKRIRTRIEGRKSGS